MHVIAAKAVAFQRGAAARSSRPTSSRSSPTPRRWPRRCRRAGLRLCSGGTDNHLMLVDLRAQEAHRQGGRGGARQGRHHREQEHDPLRPRKPIVTSGIRIGTPAHHHPRHEGGARWRSSAQLIGEALDHAGDEAALARIRGKVQELCAAASRSTRSRLKSVAAPRCAAPSARTPRTRSSTRASRTRARSSAGAASASTCKRRFTTYERVEELDAAGREEGRPPRGVRPREAARRA